MMIRISFPSLLTLVLMVAAAWNNVVVTAAAVDTNVNRQGLRQSAQRSSLVGGALTKDGIFPFAVKILLEDRVICGGVVLSDTWILTAAHCFFEKPNGETDFQRINDTRLSVSTGWAIDDPYRVAIQHTIVHPNLDLTYQGGRNDIGLIQLASPLELATSLDDPLLQSPGHRVMPIQFWPPNRSIPTGPYLAIGWGRMENLAVTDGLRSVPLLPSNPEHCAIAISDLPRRNEELICAGLGDGRDTCYGDSGSPLLVRADAPRTDVISPAPIIPGATNSSDYSSLYRSRAPWVLAGITSYGANALGGTIGCGNEGMVGVYTRPGPFIDFIVSQTGLSEETLLADIDIKYADLKEADDITMNEEDLIQIGRAKYRAYSAAHSIYNIITTSLFCTVLSTALLMSIASF